MGKKTTAQIEERILYEDNHLIVVNKLPSEIVQGDLTGDATLGDAVKLYLKETYNKQGNVFLGIPHRLDRPTSGIVVFAKTDKALSRLGTIFRDRDIKKIYWAAVDKMPPEPEGKLTDYLLRNRQKNKSFSVSAAKEGAKKAELTYRVIGATKSFYILEIELHTGRHHQIRAQLAALHIHIKGDLKYGAARSNEDGGIHLHARKIIFKHPVSGKLLEIIAPPPNDPVWTDFR
ncbi:MAG: RluA family pseudouridine synthase [Spirochaetia bacterium]|nr:RluA family pseudouridine synthase [Spirochaetia bacterium]